MDDDYLEILEKITELMEWQKEAAELLRWYRFELALLGDPKAAQIQSLLERANQE